MKKIYCLLLTAFSCLNATSQSTTKKAEVIFGPPEEASRSTLNTVFGRNDMGYFIMRTAKKDMMLEMIDYDLKTAKSLKIEDVQEGKNKREYYDEFFLNNTIFLITRLNNKELDQMEFYAETRNPSSFTRQAKGTLVGKVKYTTKGLMSSARGDISVITSKDNSKVLIYNDIQDEKGEKETFNFQVYEGSMEKLWEKKIEIPFASELFAIQQKRIDNKGNVYLTCIQYGDKASRRENKRSGTPNYKYHILGYSKDGDGVKDFEVNLNDKFITDLQIAINTNGDIVVAGFYSEKGTYSIKGAFYMLIDGKSKEIKVSNQKAFDFELITENMTEREEEKAKKKADKGKNIELYEYDLDDIKLNTDGSATLIAEQYYVRVVTTTTYGANGQVSTRTTYHYYYYNDIIVVNIGKDGNIEWTCKIPKLQHTINDGGYYSSYVCASHNDKLYFIFNDHPENIINPVAGKMKPMGKGREIAAAFVEVDETGKYKKEMLFSQEKRDVLIRPKVCRDAKEGEFFLFAEWKKDYQFSRVKIKG